jgi:hypothetical protein
MEVIGIQIQLLNSIQFNEKAIICFIDVGTESKYYQTFRNHIVEENEVLKERKKVSFATNNANYVLTYEII